jgi:hypothetical protein
VDRSFLQERQDVILENAHHLFMRTILSRLDFQLVAFYPLVEYDTEGVLVRQTTGLPLLLAMKLWIGAFGQQGARLVARLTRCPERNFRVPSNTGRGGGCTWPS